MKHRFSPDKLQRHLNLVIIPVIKLASWSVTSIILVVLLRRSRKLLLWRRILVVLLLRWLLLLLLLCRLIVLELSCIVPITLNLAVHWLWSTLHLATPVVSCSNLSVLIPLLVELLVSACCSTLCSIWISCWVNVLFFTVVKSSFVFIRIVLILLSVVIGFLFGDLAVNIFRVTVDEEVNLHFPRVVSRNTVTNASYFPSEHPIKKAQTLFTTVVSRNTDINVL